MSGKIWAVVVLVIVGMSFVIPIDSATLRAFPFFILCLYCLTKRKFWNDFRLQLLSFLFVSSVLTLGFHGLLETKDLMLFFICLCGISYMSEQFEFKPKYLYVFFRLFYIRLKLLSYANRR